MQSWQNQHVFILLCDNTSYPAVPVQSVHNMLSQLTECHAKHLLLEHMSDFLFFLVVLDLNLNANMRAGLVLVHAGS